MSITLLPTNYVDSETEQYEYKLTDIGNSEYLIEDVSTYTEEGSPFNSAEINNLSSTINNVISLAEDSTSDITKIKNGAQVVGKSDSSGVASFASNDFILCTNQTLSFVNKVCTISDERITANSIADVYFSRATLESAKKAIITADTSSGLLTLTAGRTPSTLVATIRIRRID